MPFCLSKMFALLPETGVPTESPMVNTIKLERERCNFRLASIFDAISTVIVLTNLPVFTENQKNVFHPSFH